MKREIYPNHINITFNVIGKGNRLVESINLIHTIVKRYNAQSNLFHNKSSWKHDAKGNIIAEAIGNIGGTITFHRNSCDIESAANELVAVLQALGVKENEDI